MFRSKFDSNGNCYRMGKSAEDLFKKIAIQRGYLVKDSSSFDNRVKHIDFYVEKNKSKFAIEVKARKKKSRNDSTGQSEWIWIEFKNVNGNKGWLYGEADKLAFELDDGFLIISRVELAALAEKLIDLNDIVKDSKKAMYKGYKRFDRPNELVGMINIADIKKLKHVIWKLKND